VFKRAGGKARALLSLHEVGPVFDILPTALTRDQGLANLVGKEHDVVALFDNPTGFFVWDLMEAFPDYEVVLTVRDVRGCG
jgi:hypothetical protein